MTTTPKCIEIHDSNFDNGSEANHPGTDDEGVQTFEPVNRLNKPIDLSNEDKECTTCKISYVPICNMKLEQLTNLKNSTKKLLCLLEEVQDKTHSTALVPDDPPKIRNTLSPLTRWDDDNCDNFMERSVSDIIGFDAIKKLERRTNDLDCIIIKDEDDDCSIYKRLTRKCHCLNQQEYNDFIIHFNENTKFCTNTIGEIIKNMLILKKFLYMTGSYRKNALLFLNQGLEEGSYSEKAEIIQACAFADICCIFDEHTIVTVCIFWPCKDRQLTDTETQEMTAKFLYNLAKLEEGRRYLNFNAKITCDIKKVLKKQEEKITCDTKELLQSVLDSCQPQLERTGMNSLTYHCRPMQEAVGNKTLNALIAYRQHMTLNELFLHLDIILSLSSNEETKTQLTPHLPLMLSLFRNMLLEFNNNDINIIITLIMNNIVGYNVSKNNKKESPSIACEKLTSCMATEPIQKKNVVIQFPAPKNSHKKAHHRRHHLRRRITIIDDEKQDVRRQMTIIDDEKQDNSVEKHQKSYGTQTLINQGAIKLRPPSTNVTRPKTAPNAEDKTKNQKLNDNVYHRQKSAISDCHTVFNSSRKFMGGDIMHVIVVPMEKENTVNP